MHPCRHAEAGCTFASDVAAEHSDHLDVCPWAPVDCPYGCGAELRRQDLKEHVERCPRAPQPQPQLQPQPQPQPGPQEESTRCPHCATRLARSELPAHLLACPRAPVTCEHCAATVERAQLGSHLATCVLATHVPCSLGCGAIFPRDEVAAHEARCPTLRLVPCQIGCGEMVPLKDLRTHAALECPAWRLRCGICGERKPRAEWSAHVDACRQREHLRAWWRACAAQCLACGEWRRSSTALRRHEETDCPARFVHCANRGARTDDEGSLGCAAMGPHRLMQAHRAAD